LFADNGSEAKLGDRVRTGKRPLIWSLGERNRLVGSRSQRWPAERSFAILRAPGDIATMTSCPWSEGGDRFEPGGGEGASDVAHL
jgi:hypothetical protein